MDKNLREFLTERYELLSKLIAELDRKIKLFPEGGISVKRHKYGVYYYRTGTGFGEDYLPKKDSGLINDLIQKNYYQRVLASSCKEAAAIKRALDHIPDTFAEDVYELLSNDRKALVKPIVKPIEQFVREWQETPYNSKPISDDVPVFVTMKGERVRSKSEQIIADRLYINDIPYKYECPLRVGNRIIHPDFTILRRSDRKELYHEHCGKLDDTKYTKDNLPRINDYILNGFGDRLFLSFESSVVPLDVRVIDKMINDNFR